MTETTGNNGTTRTSHHAYVGIDSSIPEEHARIIRNTNTGSLFIYNGAGSGSRSGGRNASAALTVSAPPPDLKE